MFDPDRLDRIGAVGRHYVDSGYLPYSHVQVTHGGDVVYADVHGLADVERNRPIADDTICRIYSMTKPITSIVIMQLVEEGALLLETPLAEHLPEFAEPTVFVGGSDMSPQTRPATNPIEIRHLLTHTSGLTYGFHRQTPVDARYRRKKLGDFVTPDYDLTEAMRLLAAEPLLFDPGTAWNYGLSTDVLGAVIERVTGQTLDVAFRKRIFEPLGMVDTGFHVDTAKADRLAALYIPGAGGMTRMDDPERSSLLAPPPFLSGGGGLVSTMADYQRFVDMLASGGDSPGGRIIGRFTLDYMTKNHLPGGALLNDLGQSLFSEVTLDGMGFGLGFAVIEDAAANASLCSVGEFNWGGAASTVFWVDPANDITVTFLTQLLPSSTYPIRRQLRNAVYQALT